MTIHGCYLITSPSIASLTSLSSCVSALFRNYENYGIVYAININTQVLLLFQYYFVVQIALFWNTGRGFNQYSYYCYLFRLGSAYRFWHCYCHVWVRCFENLNTTIYCMSSLLIHISNFSFCIILLLQLCCSEPRVVGLINTVIIVTYLDFGQNTVFEIVVVTCEWDVSKQRTIRSSVCQSY